MISITFHNIKIFRYYLSLEKGMALHLNKHDFPITHGCFVPSLVEIDPVVLKKKIFKVGQCIFAISLLSPFGNGWGPLFEQT